MQFVISTMTSVNKYAAKNILRMQNMTSIVSGISRSRILTLLNIE